MKDWNGGGKILTEQDSFGALIVGCGAIAGRYDTPPLLSTHCGGIDAVGGLKLVGCVDVDLNAARALADKFDTVPYSDLAAALERCNPDVVIVATPSISHRAVTEEVLRAPTSPRVVVVEKPIATDLFQYRKLLELAASSSSICLVNMSRRYSDSSTNLRKIIERGDLGRPAKVFCTYYGGLWNNGVHLIDYLDLLFSSSLTGITVTGIVPSRFPDDPCVEFKGTIVSSGADVEVKAIDERLFQAFELDIWFSAGRIEIANFGESIHVRVVTANTLGERVLTVAETPVEVSGFGQTIPLYESIEKFLRSGEDFNIPSLEIAYQDRIVGLVSEIHELSQNWRK